MSNNRDTADHRRRHWFEKWFNEHYLALYRHRDMADAHKQIRLIVDTLKPAPESRILDLGCGEGRHVRIMHDMGLTVSGIDLSETLITIGKANHPDLSLSAGDMRNIRGQWDVILSLFTSFGYFDDDAANRSIMASVSRALVPGGMYWLDYLNPDHVVNGLVPESRKTLDDGTIVIERRRIEGHMVVKDILFQGSDGEQKYQERVYLYRKEDLETMMRHYGMEPAGAFGNYGGEAWSPDMPRTILFARRNNG